MGTDCTPILGAVWGSHDLVVIYRQSRDSHAMYEAVECEVG